MDSTKDMPQDNRKREEHLSIDQKWRSFPKVPHLLQYVTNGNYYGRIKVGGKLIRESLKTNVWTTEKLRLTDFLKKHQETRVRPVTPKFKEAVELFKLELQNDSTMKPRSKGYRLGCLQKLQRTWPELWELRLDQITQQACKEWSVKLGKMIACQYYNNMIGTLRMVIGVGMKAHKEATGIILENPAMEIKRVKIKQKDLRLPESAHFKGLIENLRKKSGGWGPRAADLVEFLAYSGMRIRSEALWVTWEDIDWQRNEIIVRGNPETGTKNSEIRRLPILPDMEKLLKRLKDNLGKLGATGRILQVSRCHESLSRACKEMRISYLTHHDFRHLFATRCIESGVDVPTVSRWLRPQGRGSPGYENLRAFTE